MKKILMMLYVIAIVGLLLRCGGGSGGAGDYRVKTVKAMSPGGGTKSISNAVGVMQMSRVISKGDLLLATSTLGGANEYTATFNNIESDPNFGKIIRIEKVDGSYFVYTYTTYNNPAGEIKALTIREEFNPIIDEDAPIHTTKFYHDYIVASGVTDVVEYKADGSFESCVRYLYDGSGKLTDIQQYVGLPTSGAYDTSEVVVYPVTAGDYTAQYTYVSGKLNRIHFSTGKKDIYFTYDIEVVNGVTYDVVEQDVQEVISFEGGTPIAHTRTTVKTKLDDTIDTPVIDMTTTEQPVIENPVTGDTPVDIVNGTGTEVTLEAPVVLHYDYVYEQGSDESGNWFAAFYKEMNPFE